MRRAILFAISLALVACSGGGSSDSDPPDVDAASVNTDAPGADAVVLPACTRAVYDSCLDNSQCSSGNCHLFMQDGIQVCTQACDAANPCPQLGGQDAMCNNKGICKPPGEHACTPQ